MKFLTSYYNGFAKAAHSIRMISWIYLLMFAVALVLALPFPGLVRSMAGQSLLPDHLVNGFDATIISELLTSGGKSLLFYAKGFLPFLILFLLLQVYFNGGIISWISNPRGKFSVVDFHRNANRMFFRYLRLFFYMLLIHLIIAVIIYLPAIILMGANEDATDKWTVTLLLWSGLVHIIFFALLITISDVSKVAIYNQSTGKVLKTLWRSFRFVLRHLLQVLILNLLLLLVPVLFFVGYYLLRIQMFVDSVLWIIVLLLLQQIFIWIRLFTRTWRLGSVMHYFLTSV